MTCVPAAEAHARPPLPMNSATGSCSPSVLMVPAMLSFSRMGRKSCTKSEVYGGAMTSSTCGGGGKGHSSGTPASGVWPQVDEMPVGLEKTTVPPPHPDAHPDGPEGRRGPANRCLRPPPAWLSVHTVPRVQYGPQGQNPIGCPRGQQPETWDRRWAADLGHKVADEGDVGVQLLQTLPDVTDHGQHVAPAQQVHHPVQQRLLQLELRGWTRRRGQAGPPRGGTGPRPAHLLHHVQLGVLGLEELHEQLQDLRVQQLVAGADLRTAGGSLAEPRRRSWLLLGTPLATATPPPMASPNSPDSGDPRKPRAGGLWATPVLSGPPD